MGPSSSRLRLADSSGGTARCQDGNCNYTCSQPGAVPICSGSSCQCINAASDVLNCGPVRPLSPRRLAHACSGISSALRRRWPISSATRPCRRASTASARSAARRDRPSSTRRSGKPTALAVASANARSNHALTNACHPLFRLLQSFVRLLSVLDGLRVTRVIRYMVQSTATDLQAARDEAGGSGRTPPRRAGASDRSRLYTISATQSASTHAGCRARCTRRSDRGSRASESRRRRGRSADPRSRRTCRRRA